MPGDNRIIMTNLMKNTKSVETSGIKRNKSFEIYEMLTSDL